MRNNVRQKLHRGSSPNIPKVETESDDWGVRWIQSCREIRDDKSLIDQIKQLPERNTTAKSKFWRFFGAFNT